jgi:RNA polymerase sporulation-specific sigma factor
MLNNEYLLDYSETTENDISTEENAVFSELSPFANTSVSVKEHENSSEIIAKAQNGDEEALSLIIETNSGLVKSISLRFKDRGVEMEDIIQIGTIGMIKAVRNFDFSYGTKFSTYAVPLIMGEIKKFLRDDGTIKVSRETKRKAILVLRERERITNETGIEPTINTIASNLGISTEEAAEALESASGTLSLSDTIGETPVENFVGEDKTPEIIERLALRQAIESLPDDEKELIIYRYYKGYSQSKTALIFGITQVKVSRTEKKIIEKLKKALI